MPCWLNNSIMTVLLQLPATKVWLAIKDAKQRDTASFHQEMAAQVYEYYFRNYAVHFSSEAMSTAFATIPQVLLLFFSCDDHTNHNINDAK